MSGKHGGGTEGSSADSQEDLPGFENDDDRKAPANLPPVAEPAAAAAARATGSARDSTDNALQDGIFAGTVPPHQAGLKTVPAAGQFAGGFAGSHAASGEDFGSSAANFLPPDYDKLSNAELEAMLIQQREHNKQIVDQQERVKLMQQLLEAKQQTKVLEADSSAAAASPTYSAAQPTTSSRQMATRPGSAVTPSASKTQAAAALPVSHGSPSGPGPEPASAAVSGAMASGDIPAQSESTPPPPTAPRHTQVDAFVSDEATAVVTSAAATTTVPSEACRAVRNPEALVAAVAESPPSTATLQDSARGGHRYVFSQQDATF